MANNTTKYYLETNALYSLINKIDLFVDSSDVSTSLFAFEELIDGIDSENYHKRKVMLSKLKASKLKIYPYLPMECIAISFGLDISGLPIVQEKKILLWKKVNLVISSNDYITFVNELKEKENIDFQKEKEAIDKHETVVAKNLKELISQKSNELDAIKQRQIIEPEYYNINIEDIFLEPNEKLTYEHEKLLLTQLLNLCGISYESSDIDKVVHDYDGRQLVAFILGQSAYTWNRSHHKRSTEYNDIPDLSHLLYLKDENYVIVSNDKIYDNATLAQMRMKPDDFLKGFDN
ncbi:hypothetical protein [Clostridium minihomine]|uniref:hypothetical protein n=1 Tax=Clostridium minihomine TaxID=2045012 RepID=UPI000C77F290|nr:hypothetical protein [Clostridium minihomine]